MKEISVTDFRQRCLTLVDDLPSDGIVLTRHGRPVARVVPVEDKSPRQLGTARGLIELLPGWEDPITTEDLIG